MLAGLGIALLVLRPAPVAPAAAERTLVYSVQGAESADSGDRIKAELKKLKGVKKAEFDAKTVEVTVVADGIDDAAVLAAIERAGVKAVVGPGNGSYIPHEAYPPGADVVLLTKDGSAVGPLARLRVPGKYTAFDIYADWCGPCRLVDAHLRKILSSRTDLAVRKLNVVDFDTPLARQLGPEFDALPYVVVFSPTGKRTDILGADIERLDKALGAKR